jgi:hypothetical protein
MLREARSQAKSTAHQCSASAAEYEPSRVPGIVQRQLRQEISNVRVEIHSVSGGELEHAQREQHLGQASRYFNRAEAMSRSNSGNAASK